MDYENFKEQFVENLKEALYEKGMEDVQMREAHVDKLNGGYDAVTVTPADSNIGVTLNVGNFYKAMESGADMSEVVSKASQIAMEGLENTPVVDVNALTDYDQMKNKLVMEVVSAETNAEMLQTVPHRELEDMAVVYRFVIESNENGRATILATNDMIQAMGVTPDQLHADAMENAPQLKPVTITGMSEVIAEMMGLDAAEMMGIVPSDPKDEKMYVDTVYDKTLGAGVLAYKNFFEDAAEKCNGSYYVLPSSRHEVLLVPDNGQMSLGDLEAMVREVNATQVAPEDKLTDNVYHYDAQAKVFELGEKFVNREQAREAEKAEKAEDRGSVLGDLKAKKEEVAKQPKKDPTEKTAKVKGEASL